MALSSVRHFATCNCVTVQLAQPWYSDLKHDFERIIGRPYAGEKIVTNCQLFAFGYCPNCGQAHPTERLIYFAASPSLHKCGARCTGARGHNCECSCNGANHGVAA